MIIHDGEKSQADIEREQIRMVPNGSEPEPEKEPEVKEEETEEVEEVEEVEEDNADDEAEEEVEEELTDEEKATKAKEAADAEDDPAKLKKTIERLQKRIAKKSGNEQQLAKDLKAAQDALAAKDGEGEKFTKADAEVMAKQIADQTLSQNEFVNLCNRIAEDAKKLDPKSKEKIDQMAEDIGAIPHTMIGVLGELPNGGAVLNYLTNNIEEAEEYYALPPVKLALALNKVSEKLKPKIKKVSKLPDPKKPLGGNNRGTTTPELTGKESMADFVRIRNQQEQAKLERKYGRK